MDPSSTWERLVKATIHLLERAPDGVESLQVLHGRALRHEYMDRLATRQSWPVLALFKGSGAEAAAFIKRNEVASLRILNQAVQAGRHWNFGERALIYADLRIARRDMRWRSKVVGREAQDLHATTASERALILSHIGQG